MKQYIKKNYGSGHALNAPAHITLIAPFRPAENKLELISQQLSALASGSDPFEIMLKDFDVFKPRVIFVDVAESPELTELQKMLEEQVRAYPDIYKYGYQPRPYHPHLTIAFKDLTKKKFYKAWEEFRELEYHATFRADSICLLRHDGKRWQVYKEFSLGIS